MRSGLRNLLQGQRTVSFSESQIAAGFFGFFDTVTNAARRVMYSSNVLSATASGGDWTGIVTGSTCILRGGGGANAPFQISVDDQPFFNTTNIALNGGAPANNDNFFPVFSGLPDGPHLVRIRCNPGYNGNGWTFVSGTVLSVTGGNPNVSFPADGGFGTKWMLTDPSFPGVHTLGVIAHPGGANVLPVSSDTSPTGAQGMGGAIKIRAQCTDIWLFTNDTQAYVGVDNGTLVPVTIPGALTLGSVRSWRKVAWNCDNTAPHDYMIVPGSAVLNSTGYTLGVMIGGRGASFSAVPTTKKVLQYGDSITQVYGLYSGQTASVNSIFKWTSSLGAIGGAVGLAGQNAAGLDTTLATIRAYRNIVEDVAVIAIGRNDSAANGTAVQASITSIINKLLTAGVPKVIVRGQEMGGPAGSMVGITGLDTYLNAAVTALSNSNVVFVPVTSWTGIGTPDGGTHPDAAGYVTLAGYEQAAYAATGFV